MSSLLWGWNRRVRDGHWNVDFSSYARRIPRVWPRNFSFHQRCRLRVYYQMSLPVKEDGLSGPHTSLVSHHASEAEAGLRDTPILVSLMQDLFSTPPPPAEHSGMRHALLRGQNRFLWGYPSHQQLCNLYPQLISTSQSAKCNPGLALG